MNTLWLSHERFNQTSDTSFSKVVVDSGGCTGVGDNIIRAAVVVISVVVSVGHTGVALAADGVRGVVSVGAGDGNI